MNLEQYFEKHEFTPNDEQKEAIRHVNRPLFLVAGPGSGKTRVLLWRTFNLIVFHGVKPSEIFLSTFTEKAARQLKDGLLTLLGSVPGQYFDISEMYVGTVHSLCRRILTDRRFNLLGVQAPELMDEVDQYFHVYNGQFWKQTGKTEQDVLNELKPGGGGQSARYRATIGLISLFNRLSEECITPQTFQAQSKFLSDMYKLYLDSLDTTAKTDMSLLQQQALQVLNSSLDRKSVFKHLLIDEYQDTNTVQERIFFKLVDQNHNLCVVGDDDQALYRFRGATVENLVKFPKRCLDEWGIEPTRIDLNKNYRSSPQIVEFYKNFIKNNEEFARYRVPDKTITADRICRHSAVVVAESEDNVERCEEIAGLVKTLLDTRKVYDPNQVAFLYPSLKNSATETMIDALAKQGLEAYSPRSGRFLDCQEAKLIFGLMLQVLGRPELPTFESKGAFKNFNIWLNECEHAAKEILSAGDDEDDKLKILIKERTNELAQLGQSAETDWNLLDLFYQFCASQTISSWLMQAEQGGDEGPVCNLSLISKYLFRYQQMHDLSVIRKKDHGTNGDSLRIKFFNSYLYGLYRLEESEYEDAENPFPKGRIPFLTIHQAKGLEFPVVVLGSLIPFSNKVTQVESLARSTLSQNAQNSLEPLEKIGQFDAMRMFYVALSRAENLLVLANNKEKDAKDERHPGLKTLLSNRTFTKIKNFNLASLEVVDSKQTKLPKTFSYTADYQYYQACPRQYMLFRKYGFAPSRTRTMAFGILVHKTIEDIHRRLIDTKQEDAMEAFIKQRFDENYQILSSESSHKLAPHTLEAAHQQVIHYWGKLSHLAKTITNTEVPLTLPGQHTPGGVPYSIHGVVDMAKEGEQSHLYDIKTHDAGFVKANPGYYQEQLNVYAYIWQKLHNKSLSGTSIIATKLPADSSEASLANWYPVVSLPFNQAAVVNTIQHFGEIVDCIEGRQFHPRSSDELSQTEVGARVALADELCINCDGRFSCSSYANYLELNPDKKQKKTPVVALIPSEQELIELGNLYMEPENNYLNDEHLQGFIQFLSDMINDQNPNELNHSYTVEPVNKHFHEKQIGKCVEYKTIKDAFTGYAWKRQGYDENKTVLNDIANKLQTAPTEDDLYQACLDCLEWGAGGKQFNLYTKNRSWLLNKKQIRLSVLLDTSHRELAAKQPNLIGFKTKYFRMNSGFTKIYALKYPNFIIYDSRVAAALGLLVRRYCEQFRLDEVPTNLAFNWSGTKKRNPSLGKYQFSRLNNDSKKHAEWNVKANWMLNAVVNRLGTFWDVPQNERLRALEAALFMIGYSVIPCAGIENTENGQISNAPPAPTQQATEVEEDYDEISEPTLSFLWGTRIRQGSLRNGNLRGGWVLTDHNFTTALEYYYQYRSQLDSKQEPSCGDFKNYLIKIKKSTNNTRVQNREELNLNNKNLDRIGALRNAQCGINFDSLRFLNEYRQSVININNDLKVNNGEDIWDKFPSYLMDTYLCGQLAAHSVSEIKNILEAYSYAGRGNGNGAAAGAIISVGRSFGRHFGFLDKYNSPTELFRCFFLTTLPIEDWISNFIEESPEA